MTFTAIYVGCLPDGRVEPLLTKQGHTLREVCEVYTPQEFFASFTAAKKQDDVIVTIGGEGDHTCAILTAQALCLPLPLPDTYFPDQAEIYDSGDPAETFAVYSGNGKSFVMLPPQATSLTALVDFLDKKYRTRSTLPQEGARPAESVTASPVPAQQLTKEELRAPVQTPAQAVPNALTATELGGVILAEREEPEKPHSKKKPEEPSVPAAAQAAREPDAARPRRTRTALTCAALSVVLIAALILSYFVIYIPIHCDRVYADARARYGSAGTGELPEGMLSKFGGLYQINKEIGGWLILSNTEVNYPVMDPASGNESYYTQHLYNGDKSKYGALWLDQSYRAGEYNRNTVIHGNNFSDGRMFSDLTGYTRTLENYVNSPLISMDTVYSSAYWKIFAVYLADEEEETFDPARNTFFDDTAFGNYAGQIEQRSLIRTSVDVRDTDEILTLVTPYAADARFCICVAARKVRPLESISVNVSTASVNPDPLYPARWTGAKLVVADDLSSDLAVLFNVSDVSDPYADNSGTSSADITIGVDVSAIYGSDVQYYEEDLGGMNDKGHGIADDPDDEGASSKPASSKPASSKPASSKPSSSKPSSSKPSSSATSSGTATSETTTSGQSSSAAPQSSEVSIPDESHETVSQAPNAAACAAPLSVRSNASGTIVTDCAVNVIARIIEAEMGSGCELEALKAQAVAAYCYLKYNKSTASNPVTVAVKVSAGAKAIQAAQEVVGQILTYKNALCLTPYYAYSAGRTNACHDVWTANLPYLVPVDSSVDKQYSKFETTKSWTSAEMAAVIKKQFGVTLTGDPSKWFQITAYTTSGVYVATLNVGGQSTYKSGGKTYAFTGARMYSKLDLRSAAFDIEYDAASDTFTFHVYGYGHGVGMSQRGANYYAKAGYSYQWILAHYYPGTTLCMDPDFS